MKRRVFDAGRRLAALVAASVIAVVASAVVVSIPARAQTPEKLELRYQGWASKVLYPELAEDLGYLAPIRLKWVGNTISGPQDIQAAVTGDVDYGGAFNGSIVKLVAAHAPVKAVISYVGTDKETNGGLFVLQDSPIKGARDLIGRKIGVNTPGAYEQYLVTAYLQKSGLSKEDIEKVVFVAAPPVNLAQLLKQKQLDAVFLEDIIKDKLLADGGARLLTTDYQLLGSFGYASYLFTDKFIAQNPNTVRKFVDGTARAIEWARNTPRAEVVARLKKIVEARHRNEDTSIVNYWKSAGVGGKGGLIAAEDFTTYIDWYVNNGVLKPGQVKPGAVYSNEFNPFNQSVASK
ncbi:ABC-type nitrate/sulfonate/bicarbonate transport system, periplasmic component protein (plasmid) [Paraburkholderia caribensis MBA4]|uniref:ABC-type nitrate/sulfonate/bicarbonate transport system, periplasmic component protein n=1 Tax=Paraburkholderia caribensis MBA4 TaxID=1323664 RepID=A0A0P0RNA1_9BURK|nr:ABC transporter substrate-binding protein [Paraburkholderia caribensis]ALL70184.1 ABC-type nitrate/sulfonate/bicarbonate transport system, periplasmic component protein [Paraburkholderia caribensis MBA4]